MHFTEEEIRNADILEYDDGVLVGCGSDADYDYYAYEVINGMGYYNEDGHYISYYDSCYDKYGDYIF